MKGRLKKIVAMLLTAALTVSGVPAVQMTVNAASAEGNIDLTRQVAAEGMVLMENNGALPVKEGTRVAMFGRAMIDYVRGGGGSGETNVDYSRNILQGMQMKAEEGKVELYQPLVDFYKQKVETEGIKDDAKITVTDEMMQAAAEYASAAVITIGRYSSEGSDRKAEIGDYYLSDAEVDLLRRAAASFEHVIVVLNVGAVLDTQWIKEIDGIDAVLMGWQAGMEGGLATADVLVGDVNPSGKFVDTFAKSYEDYPSSDTFYESNGYVNYKEDIFVGYRYFETFDPEYTKVNYEFGYGMSYTTFETDDVSVSVEGEDIAVTAKVTNTGDVAGKEVVQVYFSAPQGELGKPAKELAAFGKTGLLSPGESETLTMRYAIDDMSSYDDTGKVQKSAYVLEAGDYGIYVGNSIKDAGEKGVRFQYKVDETRVTEQLTQQAAPIQLKERLLADGSYEELPISPEFNTNNTISATEPTVVECESFADASSAVSIESFYENGITQKRCIAFLNTKGYFVEYDLDVKEAGDYAVTMRLANGYAEITNCFSVYIDGKPQPGILFNARQTGDGNGKGEWYNFEESEPFYVTLPEGKIRFRIVANVNNPNYDCMTFTKTDHAPSYYMEVGAEGRTRIEAEEFGFSGGTNANGVRTENFIRDGEEATCLAYMNYQGNYVSYWLDVKEAGDYNVYFNVANGRAEFNFNPGIEIDDEAVSTPDLKVPQTGDGAGNSEWYNFRDLDPVTVPLPAGKCVLTLKAPADSYPNIDYFELEKKQAEAAGRSYAAKKPAARMAKAETNKLMLADVYNDPSLMDTFLAQLTDRQLIEMLGGQPNTGTANTGGMGNLPEFGIPNAMTADGPQGIRIGNKCTAWPVSTLLACTWDVELVKRVGKAAAVEAHQNGIDIWLAPGMNIHRDPLCGRNFEYYSEDPFLTGKMAAAITEGCQSEGVSITLKHFAANNKESNRNSSDSRMSERALREIYLKGFEIAVKEADPWSIMTSYNYINGTETSENKDMLTNIARGEWGFEGIFMTDWGNNSSHVREVLAGNDVKMPNGNPALLENALEAGHITREDIIPCIKRLLQMIMKVNVFHEKILNPPVVPISFGTKFKVADNIIWSQTVKAETTSDTDGGNNLGYCDAGGWAEYQIDVKDAGFYAVSARNASNEGNGAFDLLADGSVLTSFKAISTGGWQNWTTLPAQRIYLPEGRHTLRIAFTESGSNLNWLQFDKDESMTEIKGALGLILAKPVSGGRVSEAGVALAGTGLTYTADVAWFAGETEETEVFEADTAYTAIITVAAAEDYFFAADALAVQLMVDGQNISLEDGAVQFTDTSRTKIQITYTFDKTKKDGTAVLVSIICNAYAGLDLTAYTQESAKALSDALLDMESVMDNADASEEEIEQAAAAVLAAAAGLKPDTSDLKAAIIAAENAAKAADEVAKQALSQAAENKLAAQTAQAAADAAKDAANRAIAEAEAAKARAEAAELNAKRAMLTIVANAYTGLDTSVYTQQSVKAFQDALKTANELKGQENADGDAMLKAAQDVMKAAAALKFDTTNLEQAAKAANDAAKAAQDVADQALKEAQDNKDAAELATSAADAADRAAKAAQAKAEAAEKEAKDAKDRADAAEQAAKEAKEQFEKAQQQIAEQKAALDKLMAEAKAAREEALAAQARADETQKQADMAQQNAQKAKEQAEKSFEKARFVARKVKVLSLKSKKAGQVTFGWKPVKGADGYIIKYADNSAFKKAVKIEVKGAKAEKATVKKLKSGKKYYFKVRAYGKFNGKKLYTTNGNGKGIKVK